ncbi:MAG: zinc transporter ZntB, partial [Gammaproteobacteria bacterium]|nr:zinc transporter ZntB [Gammaproteobacteria bacterium]
MSEQILHAYVLDGLGGGELLPNSAISEHINDDEQLTWVHLDSNHENTKSWLETEASYLDPMIIEALLEDATRPRMTQFEQGVLLILRGVNLNQNSDPEDMISIRLWVDQHRIISMRRRRLKVIGDIQEKITKGHGPKDSGDLICMLANGLFDRMEPVLTSLDETTD